MRGSNENPPREASVSPGGQAHEYATGTAGNIRGNFQEQP